MGIGDKLRGVFSKDHDDTTTGTTGTTGTQGGAVNRAEQAATGHGHSGSGHRTSGTGGTTGTGTTGTGTTGTGTTGQGGLRGAEQKVESHLPGHHNKSATGTGTGTGVGNQSQYGTSGNTGSGVTGGNTGSGSYGSQTGTGSGVTGNTSGRGTTGGTHSYQVGNQAELDGRRGDMSNIMSSTPNVPSGTGGQSLRQEMEAQYDKEHWREAIEKTDLAEHEVATAAMQADQADAALAKAQQAQRSMGQHASEHDRLLAEAERQRGLVTDPSRIRGGLEGAQGDLTEAQRAAAAHNKALRDADSAYAAKKAELDGLAPKIRQHDQKLQGLGSEYDNAMAKRDAVATDAERLRAKAAEADSARGGIASTVEQLMEKLRLAEEDMVARERAFLQSRDNHRSLHEQLRRARGELDGVNATYEKNAGAADAALQSAQGWDDKTARLRAQLQEHEAEHNRLLDLINRLKAELEAMLAELEGLRRHGQPNKQAIEEAELRVNNHRNQLRQAEAQAKEAEARYRQLVKDADAHKARAADAANQAQRYGGTYQDKVKEAELHGDRHAQLWNEAQQAGNQGSSNATDAFNKLRNKVENFTHREP